MATKKFISAEEAGRIWLLHEKGLTNTEIVDVTGRSMYSVGRVLSVYKAAKHGDIAAMNRPSYANSQNIKAAAMKHFGMSATNAAVLTGREKPLNQETKKTDDLQDLLIETRRTNELLEKIISLWG